MSRRKRSTRNLGRDLESPQPVRTTTWWIRFEHEREPFGVFSYLNEARETATDEVCDEIDALSAASRSSSDGRAAYPAT